MGHSACGISYESSHIRGRVSIGHFVRGSVDMRDVVRITYIFSSVSFIDRLFLYFRYCVHFFLTYIKLILLYIWMYVFLFLSPTPSMCVSFLSLYMCFLLLVCSLLFLFHTKMPWWVLFKVFQKYRLSKSTCHKLSSCKVFQEFVLK